MEGEAEGQGNERVDGAEACAQMGVQHLGKEAVVGRGKRGEVLGWYLPVSVVDEKALTRA